MSAPETPPQRPGLAAHAAGEIAEFQGLYGAYHVSELLLQRIWLRGNFNQARAYTVSGDPIRIRHPGSWNRLAGPDFRGARLTIGSREVSGDIEVHFHAAAWAQHGHSSDPAYAGVVLHVVLYPPPVGAPPTLRSDGVAVPVLALVDLLWHDLEEYATDEAVAALSGREALPLVEAVLAWPPAERTIRLRAAAARRWEEKVRCAALRIARCGWEEACHLTALEILGYRANRAGMLCVGAAHPWATWAQPGSTPSLDGLLAAGAHAWTRRGVRPHNQPRLRLEQYCRWMSRVPDWPDRLRRCPWPAVPEDPESSVMQKRRQAGFARLRDRLVSELTGGQLGGLRADTWIINLVLPYLAAAAPAEAATHAAWWRLWTPGDIAEVLLEAARQLADPDHREVRTNETVQGLLGLHLDRMRASPSAPGSAASPPL